MQVLCLRHKKNGRGDEDEDELRCTRLVSAFLALMKQTVGSVSLFYCPLFLSLSMTLLLQSSAGHGSVVAVSGKRMIQKLHGFREITDFWSYYYSYIILIITHLTYSVRPSRFLSREPIMRTENCFHQSCLFKRSEKFLLSCQLTSFIIILYNS